MFEIWSFSLNIHTEPPPGWIPYWAAMVTEISHNFNPIKLLPKLPEPIRLLQIPDLVLNYPPPQKNQLFPVTVLTAILNVLWVACQILPIAIYASSSSTWASNDFFMNLDQLQAPRQHPLPSNKKTLSLKDIVMHDRYCDGKHCTIGLYAIVSYQKVGKMKKCVIHKNATNNTPFRQRLRHFVTLVRRQNRSSRSWRHIRCRSVALVVQVWYTGRSDLTMVAVKFWACSKQLHKGRWGGRLFTDGPNEARGRHAHRPGRRMDAQWSVIGQPVKMRIVVNIVYQSERCLCFPCTTIVPPLPDQWHSLSHHCGDHCASIRRPRQPLRRHGNGSASALPPVVSLQ